uniref:Uncharacterized protein n=1 Tax=Anguilla anguilla TaxID=7936 RepID=A0A0E9UKL6_ANGAN
MKNCNPPKSEVVHPCGHTLDSGKGFVLF